MSPVPWDSRRSTFQGGVAAMNAAEGSGRKRLPHLPPLEFPNQTVLLFVSQVVQGRRSLLDRPPGVEALLAAWGKADHWQLGRDVIMPDHVHLFWAPARSGSNARAVTAIKIKDFNFMPVGFGMGVRCYFSLSR